MLSKDKEEYNKALEELNNAWKLMYPNDKVAYVSLSILYFYWMIYQL
jgi:hypothetical protein